MSDQAVSDTTSTVDQVCAARAAEARAIEEAHQAGLPIEKAYLIFDHAMVLLAYQKAPYQSYGFQQEQIETFVTDRFIECHRANGQ